ncbi:hypothetical protein GOP47_0015775 [Adiantum capillus-veneris]|uniref:Uncharacterized protein n=1 Tax=Adiantum capillus-veneris TaxID=13818 RepID=A0A9D4ZBY4_ADICA|nr:hypothetical protein GOP47_0015775 [Adiantum capillus-veneris]
MLKRLWLVRREIMICKGPSVAIGWATINSCFVFTLRCKVYNLHIAYGLQTCCITFIFIYFKCVGLYTSC